MHSSPHDQILKLYTDTMREVFSPEEQAQIVIVARSNQLDLQGPTHLKDTLMKAVLKKMKGKENAA